MRKLYFLMIMSLSFAGLQAQERTQAFTSSQDSKWVKYYPNPAVSYINFEFQRTSEKNLQLQIINSLGRKVYEINSTSSKNIIVNLNEFYRGIYIFQLRDASGRLIESGKFQVSK